MDQPIHMLSHAFKETRLYNHRSASGADIRVTSMSSAFTFFLRSVCTTGRLHQLHSASDEFICLCFFRNWKLSVRSSFPETLFSAFGRSGVPLQLGWPVRSHRPFGSSLHSSSLAAPGTPCSGSHPGALRTSRLLIPFLLYQSCQTPVHFNSFPKEPAFVSAQLSIVPFPVTNLHSVYVLAHLCARKRRARSWKRTHHPAEHGRRAREGRGPLRRASTARPPSALQSRSF